jgi:hypothetical protein
MCGPADDQRLLQELPDWLIEQLNPVRCLPPLGVHEWCEHDPSHPPPSFQGLTYEVAR